MKIKTVPTIGPVVRNHKSSKKADEQKATRRTTCRSLSFTYISDIFTSGSRNSCTALRINNKWGYNERVRGDPSRGPVEIENPNKNDNEGVRRDPLGDLPEWSEEFPKILWMIVYQNTETHPRVPLVNYLQSREQQWCRVSTVFILISRRTEIATSAWEPKLQGLLAENALVQSCPERTNWWFNDSRSQSSQWRMSISTQLSIRWCGTWFGNTVDTDNSLEFGKSCEDLSWNRITNFSKKEVNRATIIDWQRSGYNHTRVKQKLLRRPRRAWWNSWSRRGNRKSLILTVLWSLAKPVESHPEIIVRQHLTDRKQMGLLRERCAEVREGHMRYCFNQVWMKNGVRIPWNSTAICETYKTSCLMGRRHSARGGSEYHLQAWLFRLVRSSNITYFRSRSVATASVWSESLTRCILRLCFSRGDLEKGDILVPLEKMDASKIHAKRLNVKEQPKFLEKIRIWEHPP